MGVSIDTYGASFIKYLPGVVRSLQNTSLLRQIPLGDVQWEGEKIVFKIHVAYNTSIADISDGGQIPAADQQHYIESEALRKMTVGSVQVTDGILKNAKTTKGAAIRVVDSELRGMLEGMRYREGFFLPRDGSAVVAVLVAGGLSGASIRVSDARGMWEEGFYEIRAASVHDGYAVGDVIATFQVASKARTYTSGYATVTLKAALPDLNQAAGDYIVWGAGGTSSWQKSITGLARLIDNTAGATFQAVNTGSYPRFTAPVFNGGGASQNMTARLFRQIQATLKQESPDYKIPGGMLVYTSVWDGINVEEIFEHQVRLTPDSRSVGLKGGMTFNSALGEITVLSDPLVQYGYMFFINRKSISRPVQMPLSWRPGGVSGVFNRSDDFAGYTATAMEIHDLMIKERSSNAKVTNLAVSPQSAY